MQKREAIHQMSWNSKWLRGWVWEFFSIKAGLFSLAICLLMVKTLFFFGCSGISLSQCDWKTFNLSSYMYCPVTFYNNKAFVLAEVRDALRVLQRGYKQKKKKGKNTTPLQVIPQNFKLAILHIRSAVNPFIFYLYSHLTFLYQ